MVFPHTIKESSRKIRDGDREFSLRYRLSANSPQDESETRGCSIEAELVEQWCDGRTKVSVSSVDIDSLYPEVGSRIFDSIACADSPVFPVHLGDVVGDHIRGMTLYRPDYR